MKFYSAFYAFLFSIFVTGSAYAADVASEMRFFEQEEQERKIQEVLESDPDEPLITFAAEDPSQAPPKPKKPKKSY